MTGGADGRPYDQSERAGQRAAGRRVLRAAASPATCCTSASTAPCRAAPSPIHVECEAEGHGIDPTDPPWVWEALGADGWVRCDVEDRTGGFNEPGDVDRPRARRRTSRRCSRSARAAGCAAASSSRERRDADRRTPTRPLLRAVDARRVGGTVDRGARRGHRRRGRRRLRGRAGAALRAAATSRSSRRSGRSSSRSPARRAGSRGSRSRASARAGRTTRTGGSTPTTAPIVFGPAVRMEDGSLRSYGADPAGRRPHPGPPLPHRRGPGRQRRRPRDRHAALGDPVHRPRRQPPAGGRRGRRRDACEAAKTRGPLVLGTRNRAVTARDYEQLAREATPEVARVRCLPVDEAGGRPSTPTTRPACAC